ncbi:DUF3857 domain-containing protein [Mucilaginibacter pallidiroseus]|uniref:DUF3857 domain-containing protein n=1 Tax=Mucilaginibacter pallidiroseus TaxID=2599295 RepID=A0A563UJN7_9SPHI|nr:DUF3857 domain-containing protein [Mucilaginibacter pallidiroseus]TWR31584.1 DUF3857 domain-containing protein [Mucilaginibacter pallidiroseus]
MIKRLLLLLIALSCAAISNAQKFPYGQFTVEELNMPRYNNDTSAHAVVLNEFGETRLDVTSNDRIKVIFDYHVKIKIFDNKGFEKGTVAIPFYTESDDSEDVEEIKAIITYKDEQGSVKQAELDPGKIVRVKENKYWSEVRFAIPNLRAGCVIEYSYRHLTPYFSKFPSWNFQDDIPKVRSQYEVHIPAFWSYNAALKGFLKLTRNESKVERACFTSHGASCDCSYLTFGIDNIPAFIEEDYMTAPRNYISNISFTLSEYTNPYTGVKIKVARDWRDVDYNLKKADYFGSQIRRKDIFKEQLTPLLAGKQTQIDKAKAVYAFIQSNIKWNDMNSRGSDDGIKKALDKHSGNVADINLALINALNTAGVTVEPMLLSTRVNGLINKLYPVETDFNYVIARAIVEKDTFLLDATDPLMSFGMLPLRAINDEGRIMHPDRPSYWAKIQTNQRKSSTTSFNLTLQPNGKLTGTVTMYSSGFDGYEKRKAIKKFNTTDEYIENLDERLNKIKIVKAAVNNIDSLDKTLVEQYDIEIDAFDNLNHNRLSLNPYIFDRLASNPFKLDDRNYPVDWGMPTDRRVVINVSLPDGYVIESSPTDLSLGLPNKGGLYITNFAGNGNKFTFSNIMQFNKSIYYPEEYPYLKEMYNRIITAQKGEIVFKKK